MDKDAYEKSQESYLQVEKLIDEVIEMYYKDGCACEHPRFLQMVSIDCVDYKQAFVCWETELMIGRASESFSIKKMEPTKSEYLEKWTCNHCGSEYVLSWSEFSVAVDRKVLKAKSLKKPFSGKEALIPIPLHAGLYGHGYPSQSEIRGVDYQTLRNYLLEDD